MTDHTIPPDLTVTEVADHLRVRRQTIYDAIASGALRAYKVSTNGTRITPAALADWKASLAVGADQ